VHFVRENSHSLLGPWSFVSIRQVSRPFAIVCGVNEEQIVWFRTVARKYHDTFGWGASGAADRQPGVFGIRKKDFPAIGVVDMQGERFYKYTRAVEIERVGQWLATIGANREMVHGEQLEIGSEDGRIAGVVRVTGMVFAVQ
jgi:hypothetical protein